MKLVFTQFHYKQGKYQIPAEILYKEKRCGEWLLMIKFCTGTTMFIPVPEVEKASGRTINLRKIRKDY